MSGLCVDQEAQGLQAALMDEEGNSSHWIIGGMLSPILIIALCVDGSPTSGNGLSDLIASSNTCIFFCSCRALPVMYAVALDLRVFANNVSSILSLLFYNPDLVSVYCLLSCHSLQEF